MGGLAWNGSVVVYDIGASLSLDAHQSCVDIQDHGSRPIREHDPGTLPVSTVGHGMDR